MIKKFLAIFIAVTMLIVNTGCMNKASSSEVYFLNFKPEVAKVYDEIVKVYKNETGKDVKIVTAASGTYEQTLKSEIAKSSAPTIFQVNGPIGFVSWEKYCADLTDTALYNNLNDKEIAIKKSIAQWCGYYAFTDISNGQIKWMDKSINYQIKKHKLNTCKVNIIDVLLKTRKRQNSRLMKIFKPIKFGEEYGWLNIYS